MLAIWLIFSCSFTDTTPGHYSKKVVQSKVESAGWRTWPKLSQKREKPEVTGVLSAVRLCGLGDSSSLLFVVR